MLSVSLGAFSLLFLAVLAHGATFSISPSTVSNTYQGSITLQIGGLTNGEAVVIQKFTDANTNGAVDAADWLVQQSSLTDGGATVIGGVTNFNVPYDTTPVDGTVTARASFITAGIAQQFVGKYLYRLSSPAGRFAPLTNAFTVTNFPYAQSFSGTVRSSGTNVPHAGVLVFTPDPTGEGLGEPVAGTVANSAGAYSIKVPAGDYVMWAFQNGYLANVGGSPLLTLTGGGTVSTNLSLLPGTRTITGRVVDAANTSVGLPGIMAAWSSTDGHISVQFSDSAGNYTAAAAGGWWEFGGDDTSFMLSGYLMWDDWPYVNTSTGNVAGVTIPVTKGTALFYGTVTDDAGQPVPGLYLYGSHNDWNGPLASMAITDQNGKYVMAINAGQWAVEVDTDLPAFQRYLFSPAWSGNFTFVDGQTRLQDVFALRATQHLSGWVRQTNDTPIGDVGVWSSATIGGRTYNGWQPTDSNGNYSLPAANGSWTVGLNCYDGDHNLQQSGDFQCPANQTVNISNADGVANFTVQPNLPLRITTTTLPDGTKDGFYSQQLFADGGQPPYYWVLPQGTTGLPPGTLALSSAGVLSGTPTASGTYQFWVGVWDNTWSTQVTKQVSLTINGGATDTQVYYVAKNKAFLQLDASSIVSDTNSSPFNASLGIVQSSLGAVSIATVTLPTTVVKAFPAGSTALELVIREHFATEPAFDAAYPAGNYAFALYGVHDGMKSPVLNLPTPAYPNAPRVSGYGAVQAVNPAQSFLLQWEPFSGGTADDSIWVVITDTADQPIFSTPYPPMNTDDSLSGTDTFVSIPAGTLQYGRSYRGRIVFFKILNVDTTQYPGAVGVAVATAMTTFPMATLSGAPTLSQPEKPSPSEFRFLVHGIAGQSYTIEGSSNLTDWNAIRVTNAPTDTFAVHMVRATNNVGFFRVKLSP